MTGYKRMRREHQAALLKVRFEKSDLRTDNTLGFAPGGLPVGA